MKQERFEDKSATTLAPPKVLELAELDIHDVTKGETGKEENVKIGIIVPLLRELGYTDMKDMDFEYKSRTGPADIALIVNRRPKVIVEVKSPEKELDDHVDQGLRYAIGEQIPYVLLTNGREFRLYKSFIENIVNARDRELLRIKKEELPSRFSELGDWISRESLKRRKLDTLANRKAVILRSSITPKTLVEHLREAKELLISDMGPKLETYYDEDDTLRSKIDEWISESGLEDARKHQWLERLTREAAYSFINRLYFYRIAEDKGIVRPKLTKGVLEQLEENINLLDLVKAGFAEITQVDYEAIFKAPLFSELNDVSPGPLKRIVHQLAQYNFMDMGRDIIGRIYELHIDKGERRALGQFYTPQSIIDFILDLIPLNSARQSSTQPVVLVVS